MLSVGALLIAFGPNLGAGTRRSNDFMIVLQLTSSLAWIVSYIACLLYIRGLARRIPDDKLVLSTRRLIWIGPMLLLVALLAGLMMVFNPFFGVIGGLVLLAVAIGALVWLLLYAGLLDRLRRVLKQARALAEAGAPPSMRYGDGTSKPASGVSQ